MPIKIIEATSAKDLELLVNELIKDRIVLKTEFSERLAGEIFAMPIYKVLIEYEPQRRGTGRWDIEK